MSVLRHPKEEDIRDIGKGHLGISTQVQGQTDDDILYVFSIFFPDSMFFYDYGALVIIHYSSLLTIIAPMRSAVRIAGRSCGERIEARQPQQQLRQCGQGGRDDDPTGCRSLQTGKNVHLQNEKKLGDALI
jgi:hypothetical protein